MKKVILALLLALGIFFPPVLIFAQKPVTFIYHQSLIFLRVKVNEKKSLLFLMDTGANVSSIDNASCNKLKLTELIKGDSIIGTAGKEQVTICKAKSLQLTGVYEKNVKLLSRDLSRFVTPNNERLNGIIGTDILKKYAVTIDYGKRTVTFSKKKPQTKREKVVGFEMVGGIPRFEARFNDTFTSFVNYNSGVSNTPGPDVFVNVSHHQWTVLKSRDRYLTPFTHLAGDGVGGRVQLPVVKIKSLSLNGLEVQKPNLVVQPREGVFTADNSVGFFGNSLLEKYRKVTLDFFNNRLILHTVNHSVAVHTIKKR